MARAVADELHAVRDSRLLERPADAQVADQPPCERGNPAERIAGDHLALLRRARTLKTNHSSVDRHVAGEVPEGSGRQRFVAVRDGSVARGAAETRAPQVAGWRSRCTGPGRARPPRKELPCRTGCSPLLVAPAPHRALRRREDDLRSARPDDPVPVLRPREGEDEARLARDGERVPRERRRAPRARPSPRATPSTTTSTST